jgi:hypothetical protein
MAQAPGTPTTLFPIENQMFVLPRAAVLAESPRPLSFQIVSPSAQPPDGAGLAARGQA